MDNRGVKKKKKIKVDSKAFIAKKNARKKKLVGL